MKIQGKSKKEIPKRCSRGLKLAVLPKMQQNPFLELNNGGVWRVPCKQQNILAALSFLHFVCSALQYAVASLLPGKSSHMQGQLAQNSTLSLCSSSFLECCNISSFSILVTASPAQHHQQHLSQAAPALHKQ
ncbi:hypothetical protein GQ457_02G022880 [Hibiscus cannabinus]